MNINEYFCISVFEVQNDGVSNFSKKLGEFWDLNVSRIIRLYYSMWVVIWLYYNIWEESFESTHILCQT